MAMSQAEFNRINAQDRKIMELEARLWTLEKEKQSEFQAQLNDLRESIGRIVIKRKPGRPKRAEQDTNPSRD